MKGAICNSPRCPVLEEGYTVESRVRGLEGLTEFAWNVLLQFDLAFYVSTVSISPESMQKGVLSSLKQHPVRHHDVIYHHKAESIVISRDPGLIH
jgi:hypothetical protein